MLTQISNAYTQYRMNEKNVYFPILFTFFVAWYFLFPWRHIFKRQIKLHTLLENNCETSYKDQIIHFYEDYMRNNPATSKKGWEG